MDTTTFHARLRSGLICGALIFCLINKGNAQTGTALTYSGLSPLTGTLYFPIGGGALPSGTEAPAATPAAFTAVVSNFFASLSTPPGPGTSVVFTWRDSGVSQPLTCTVTGAVQLSCTDLSHTFTATQGDQLDIQVSTTGSLAGVERIVLVTQFGDINGVPSGAIILSLTACPSAYSEVTALNGVTLIGTLFANGDVGTTGGSNTITPAGTVAAPVFTGAALPGHAHELPFILDTAAPRFHQISPVTFGTGTARPSTSQSAQNAHVVTAPVALSQSVSAGTPAGSVSAPAFSGVPFDNRSAFVKVIFCSKN
jgi:hypothetical protein